MKQVGSKSEVLELCNGSMAPTISGKNSSLQSDLNKIDNGLNSEDADTQLEAARKLRILLSSERDVLIRQVLEKNWTPRLVKWLRLRDRPTLQVEALWALTNIAAGAADNTSVLLQNGVIPTLVSLLDSKNEEVLEQSVWVLGNLAGEGPTTRDSVLNAGALPALVSNLRKDSSKLSLLRIITWTISNLCDGQPRPVFDISLVLPDLGRMLKMEDTEILSHACWALSHLCDGPSTHIQSVVNSNVCVRLVELLGHRAWRVTKPALRAIGNIVCAEDDHDYTQHIIECGAVPFLRQLIGHSNREIQKEACWTLSNVAAGTVDQIQFVLDSGSIPPLISLASSATSDAEVRSEACWVVLNATSCGSDTQIQYLVEQGCISVIGNLLEETSMVMMALEGLERILQVGEIEAKRTGGSNPYASLMATTKIETLENHKSIAVSKRASRIWRQHFVTCAICQGAFSKHSNDTFFCDECKCNVCKNCNCTVFHLQYQESLWKEETEKETSEKQAKQASKRSKRQKKRQRTKERKAALRQQQKADDNGDEKNSADEVDLTPLTCEDDEDTKPSSSVSQRDSTKSAKSPGKPSSKSPSGSRHKVVDRGSKDIPSESSIKNVSSKRSPSMSPQSRKFDRTLPSKLQGRNNYPDDPSSGSTLDDLVDANDKYVSFLRQTGSIVALAEVFDKQDADAYATEEETLRAIHA